MLNVPHDPVALEEHFRDDDEGPVSNQGYMPYLNKFILEKVSLGFLCSIFPFTGFCVMASLLRVLSLQSAFACRRPPALKTFGCERLCCVVAGLVIWRACALK